MLLSLIGAQMFDSPLLAAVSASVTHSLAVPLLPVAVVVTDFVVVSKAVVSTLSGCLLCLSLLLFRHFVASPLLLTGMVMVLEVVLP